MRIVMLAYSVFPIPIAAGVLYPAFGILLSPMIAAAEMSFSSVSVIDNAFRLRSVRISTCACSARWVLDCRCMNQMQSITLSRYSPFDGLCRRLLRQRDVRELLSNT